jgi:hypothetical protein
MAQGRVLLARHWPFLVILALAAALRVVAWLAIHPAWWILGDSISYLQDALQLQPDRWRPSGYSLLVILPLAPAQHIALVTAVQHVMGLTVGLLMYAILLRLGLPRWAATLAAIPALFDGYVVASEQMLAAEATFVILVVGALALLLWRGGRPQWWVAGAAGLLLGLAAITRTVGLPLIALPVLVLLLPRPAWSRLAALSAAFALPICLYAGWFAHTYGQVNLTASTGIFLYGRATQFVDCGRVHFSDQRLRLLCPTEPIGSRNELYYVFNPSSPPTRLGLSLTATNDMAGRFASEAIRAQPADYLRLSWTGVVATFEWDQSSLFNDLLFIPGEVLPPDARPIGLAYQGGRDPGPFDRPALAHAMLAYEGIAMTRGTLCLLALLVAAVAMIFGRDQDGRGLRAALVLTAGTAALLLLVPAMTAGIAPRYRVPAIPEVWLAVAISASLLVNRWRARRTAL